MSRFADEPTGGRSVLGALWEEFGQGQPVADGVFLTLREGILSGRLQPGERLGEEHLARSFGVSRTPVREAIFRLQSENLVLREERRGAVVRGMPEQDVLEAYALRATLDGLAARLAATHAYPADHARLRWLNDRMAEADARHEFEIMTELHFEFHAALCEAAHNTMLLRFTRQIQDCVRRFQSTSFLAADRADNAAIEHQTVLDAVERGDAALAEELARQHTHYPGEVRISMLRHSDRSSS